VITVEEIENLLHESLLLSFNTEIEDGSIEEVRTISWKCRRSIYLWIMSTNLSSCDFVR